MSDLRIIITGGRHRNHQEDYNTLLEALYAAGLNFLGGRSQVIIQGGCPTGIDAMARKLAADYHNTLETFPADWKKQGRAAGPIRNQAMADAGADLCLAFPSAGKSLGTWDMIRRACAAGIETRIYPEAKHE